MRVLVLPDAAARVDHEIERAGADETGGLLLGWRRTDLDLATVAYVTGPGARSRATPTNLRLDTADLQREVDRWFAETEGDITYLGDWHLHHSVEPVPSPTDRMSALDIAGRPKVGLPMPLIVIVGLSRGTTLWRGWVGPNMIPVQIEFVSDTRSG